MTPLPPAFVVSIDAKRLAQFCKAWAAVGLPADAVREWRGVSINDGMSPDGRFRNGQLGNAVAQYALVRHAIASGMDSLLVFEDDAVPCDSCATDLPAELEAARARGDVALRLGWIPCPEQSEDEWDGSVLMGSHAYALLSRRAMFDYCDAWTRNGKADYIFGVMLGPVGRASHNMFIQHVPSGRFGIHFPSGWSNIVGRKELKEAHSSFVKAAAAIGAEPPEFSA